MTRRIVLTYSFLATVETGIGLFLQIFLSSIAPGQSLGGYSLFNLILIAAFSVFFVGGVIFLWRIWRNPDYAERISRLVSSPPGISRLLCFFGTVSVLLITVLLTPPYWFGSWESYLERLALFIWWGAVVGAQTTLFLLLVRQRSLGRRALDIPRKVLLLSGLFFLALILTLIWVAWTKIGIVSPARTIWYTTGVPLLPGQVWFMGWLTVAFCLACLLWKRLRSARPQKPRRWNSDLLIGLGIWALAAVLWAAASLPSSFFFPGPYPPSNVIYPYADSATWDMGGHFALIGEGFGNDYPFQDHVGWMGFLTFMHLLVGEDYAKISAIQAGLLAVFPALMYWLGKFIHNRWTGFFIAGLTIFHELNSFAASNMIDLSHARFLLTEYPTRVGLAALALLLVSWLRAPRKNIAYAVPVGGLLGFLVLIRFNLLAFPLAVFVGTLLVFQRDWKGWLRASFLVTLSLTLVLSPWMWRTWVLSGTPFFFSEKSQKIFDTQFRFQPSVTPTPSSSLQNPFENTRFTSDAQLTPIARTPKNSMILPASVPALSLSGIILNHLIHNLVASTLILPTSLSFDDVERVIYEVHPYWEKSITNWQGELTPLETILLIINLALISLGLALSWRKWKLVGLIPLAVCLTYALSLAVARTSGGRYIVPMDWGIIFYWGIGISQAVMWGARRLGADIQESSPPLGRVAFSYKQGWLSLLPFLFFVTGMVVIDRATPSRYDDLKKVEVLKLLVQSGVLEQTDISQDELAAFLKQKLSQAYFGRGLYPRYYGMNQGEYASGVDAYEPQAYPRFAFTLIGTFKKRDIILPWTPENISLSRKVDFPNATDVIVVGCSRSSRLEKNRNIVDALLVVLMGDKPLIYVRNPSAPLQCPIPQPVCDSNSECR